MTNKEHPLSWQALGRLVLVGLGIFLAWKAIDVMVAILIALILATAAYPFVKRLQKHMKLLPATIIVFGLILVPFVLFGVFIVPEIISEIPALLGSLHQIFAHLTFLPADIRSFDITTYFTQHSADIVTSTKTVATGLVDTITVFFMAFYFTLDNERFLGFFLDLFSKRDRTRTRSMLMEVARVNGQYIRGNVFISLICALYLFIALTILHVPFALPLAIFAGILDLLPLVGGTLGSIPALIIAYVVSPFTCLLVLILHLVYQQIENVVLSPTIYNKTLDISPALIFISVVIGGGLFGILGAFLALPVAASLPPVVRYYNAYQKDHAAA